MSNVFNYIFKHKPYGSYERYFKRLLDIICALLVLIIFCWLYAIIAILVRVKLGSPVLFKQDRPGKIDLQTGKERIFKIYKFRTMTNARDMNGELLSDNVRLTRFGKILRSTSLDELPEVWNILKGDMSVVGPRPLAVQYLPYYNEVERERHLVRPGLSGLAQVNGRNTVEWETRFMYDIKYVKKITFIVDLHILILTFSKVFKRSDIGERGINTPADFDVHRLIQQVSETSEHR